MPDRPLAAVAGLGVAVPRRVMTNADFEKILDTSDEWITQRTGIRERRIAGEGESTASLAAAAARNALADAHLAPSDIELIICATVTPELIFPATACLVQQELGVKDIPAFDISAACSGFIYALSVAARYIEGGIHKRVLIIGAEALSRFTDYTDRSSCVIFGDGAGAAVLEAATDGRGLQYSVLHADGGGWQFIYVPDGGAARPSSRQTVESGGHYIKMRGRDIYKFAVEKMQWLLGDCMEHCGLTAEQVDLVVPHQVNVRILQSAAEKFNFPMEKIAINIDRYGNTAAASIPLAFHEARQAGRIKPGSTILLIAFGAGLTWAGAVLKM